MVSVTAALADSTHFSRQRGGVRLGWVFGILGLILALLVALVWLFPASVAMRWIAPQLQPLTLDQASGSVWNGRAHASINGESLGQLSWQASPLSLIGVQQRMQLQLSGGPVIAEVDLAPGKPGEVQLYPTSVRLSASRIASLLDTPALQFSGDIHIDIDSALLGLALPREMRGRAVWYNAAVSGAAQAVFGDLEAQFASPSSGGLQGRLLDHGGPLQLEGEFRLDYMGYSAQATLRARDGNPSVQEALRYIGEPQPDGSSRFELKGSLMGASK